MSNDSIKRTLTVALSVCIVCSVLVSAAAVRLRPLQEKNKLLETRRNILVAGGLYEKGMDINQAFNEKIEQRMVDLSTGEFIEDADPTGYELKAAAKDPKRNQKIAEDDDLADIKVRPKNIVVYMVKEGGQLKTLIMPIYGKGLWSTMYAFMALEKDASTVRGLSFYDHGETPGLGGEVDNPRWKAQWEGKKLFDKQRNLEIQIVKGQVAPDAANKQHKVDGLAGATLTQRGVENLIRYWMGPNGYGPLLQKIRQQGV